MSDAEGWSAADLPDFSGKTVVITGANSGIGYEAALALARRHATVILACRSLERARAAAAAISAAAAEGAVEVMELDLASLKSVKGFAESFHQRHHRLDVLCNNAGVMALPYRRTADGFEMQFGTNHLGHFALTILLLDLLLATPGARVVTVSSGMHWVGSIRFDNLQWERGGYRKWLAYGRSKLANLLFAFELQRKADRIGAKLISAGCNPGYAATNLQSAGPRMSGSPLMESLWAFSNRYFAENAATGALPTLYAAAAPALRGGDYIAPIYYGRGRGLPHRARCSAAARDPQTAARLWEVSEQLTGCKANLFAGPGITAG
jgi:NAD(P)-dependent dehydrogenase (short-subunit alcohol dehydrogenase family)